MIGYHKYLWLTKPPSALKGRHMPTQGAALRIQQKALKGRICQPMAQP